jgi:hypothetical protein
MKNVVGLARRSHRRECMHSQKDERHFVVGDQKIGKAKPHATRFNAEQSVLGVFLQNGRYKISLSLSLSLSSLSLSLSGCVKVAEPFSVVLLRAAKQKRHECCKVKVRRRGCGGCFDPSR